jgi:Reverse transcriptase (RNA-dependent DNA polymerase)/Endonuclease-reverse transcriptase
VTTATVSEAATSSELKVWYSNTTSMNNKVNEVRALLSTYRPDIFCVAETWFTSVSDTHVDEYILYRMDRSSRGGGVAIYVNGGLSSSEVYIPELTDQSIEQIWASVTIGRSKLLIGCIYRPGTLSAESNNRMLKSVSAAKKAVKRGAYTGLILAGDFNYHSIDWSNDHPVVLEGEESQAGQFVECLRDNYLAQLITEPTFQKGDGTLTNAIDLIITDKEANITDIKHLPPIGSSVKGQGHHLIEFKFKLNTQKMSKKSYLKYNYYKGEFDKMCSCLNQLNWNSIFKSKTIDEMYEAFMEIYDHMCEKFIPKRSSRVRSDKCWMTQEIKRQIKRKNQLWVINRNSKWSQESLQQEYKKCKYEVSKLITRRIKEYEQSIASKAKSDPKLLYQYLNNKTGIKTNITTLQVKEGEYTEDTEVMANLLNEYFQSVYNIDEIESTPLPDAGLQSSTTLTICNIEIREVIEQLEKLDPKKAFGTDGVHPLVLKRCAKSFALPLYLIFNESLKQGSLPNKWKQANVTPLFKKGKRTLPSNYRPVSLTSVVCKTIERILAARMTEYLEKNKLLSRCQHGFTKGKSCTTNLLEYLDILTHGLANGDSFDVLYTDFSKAFDTVSHSKLIHKIRSYGFDEQILKWLNSFLIGRKQRVIMGDSISRWLDVLSGVPQGSVLGPLMFLLFVNDIPECVCNTCLLYADDNKLIAKVGSKADSLKLQKDIDKLCEWSKMWQVSFNYDKCKIMHFGKLNPKDQYYMTDFDGKQIQINVAKLEKDVGVTISDDLCFSRHIQIITARANQMLGLVDRSFTFKSADLIKRVYCAFVRPHLEYCVQIWNPHLKKDINMIENVQRRATKMIPELRHKNYSDRLKELNLTTLEARRMRGDLIQHFKITKGMDKVCWRNSPLPYNPKINLRGHGLKIQKEKVTRCRERESFFINRVSRAWNALPSSVVESTSVGAFKTGLDRHLCRQK